MAGTEQTGEEALAEQAGTAFAEGNCGQALELLVQLQKQREDGALLLFPPYPSRNPASCGDRADSVGVGAVRVPPLDRHRVARTRRQAPTPLARDRALTAARVHVCVQTPRFCTTRPCHSMC